MSLRLPTGADPSTLRYDLISIGSGPAGRGAAILAARLGKKAAVIERESMLGGASMRGGVLPLRTLRAAVAELTGPAHVSYGRGRRRADELTIEDLLWRTQQAAEHEHAAVQDELRHHRIDVFHGNASFVDPHTLEIRGQTTGRVSADVIVVAVGLEPSSLPLVDSRDFRVHGSDDLGRLDRIPSSLTVIGATTGGLELASIAAALGTKVALVGESLPRCVDDEVADELRYYLSGLGIVFRLGDEVEAITPSHHGVETRLRNGERVVSEVAVHAGPRAGATRELGLGAAMLEADVSGHIAVDSDFRTTQRHIFAVGDVIGAPAQAPTSMEQGRRAALAAFGEPALPALLPYYIYTIPEIASVGAHERDLSEAESPFVRGVARFRDLPRGWITSDRVGFLKLLVHADSRAILGVHVFGTSATELVHIGQTVMAAGLPVDYVAQAAFGTPTLAEAYRAAAADAADRLDELTGSLAF